MFRQESRPMTCPEAKACALLMFHKANSRQDGTLPQTQDCTPASRSNMSQVNPLFYQNGCSPHPRLLCANQDSKVARGVQTRTRSQARDLTCGACMSRRKKCRAPSGCLFSYARCLKALAEFFAEQQSLQSSR